MIKFRNFKLISLVCILAFALVFIGFHFLQAQVETKSKPPGKPKPPPDPLIELQPGDIVTTEENALRVWEYFNPDPRWSTDTPGYSSVAVGDVDGDEVREIVVAEIREVKGRGKNATSYSKIFINVYKAGESEIPWRSTDYEGGYLREEDYPFDEVITADVDDDGKDEVILLTHNNLAVFDYDSGKDIFVMKQKTSEIIVGPESHFEAVTAADLDGDQINEILVSAWDGDQGCVYILNKDLSQIEAISVEPAGVDVFLGHRSLRVANLDGDDALEICSAGNIAHPTPDEMPKVSWQGCIIVWDFGGVRWEPTRIILPGWEEPTSFPYLHMDVGELVESVGTINCPGEEIVVSANYPGSLNDYRLILYNYSTFLNSTPVLGRITDVEIDDVNNEIVLAGSARLSGAAVFYLEVFDPALSSIWQRIGERKEGRVLDTAIVK